MGGPERKSKHCRPQTTNDAVQPRPSHWTILSPDPSFFSPAALPSARRLTLFPPLYPNLYLALVTAQLPGVTFWAMCHCVHELMVTAAFVLDLWYH